MPIELALLSNHLILCYPLFLLPSIFPIIRIFSNELALFIRWPKYWSVIFSISPFYEYSGLISFRIYWFDLAVQKTLKSHLQQACMSAQLLQLCLTLCSPWTVTHQAPLSMGFSRQEYWSGLLCHSSRGCPQPRAQTCVSCIASKLFIAESLWKSFLQHNKKSISSLVLNLL